MAISYNSPLSPNPGMNNAVFTDVVIHLGCNFLRSVGGY